MTSQALTTLFADGIISDYSFNNLLYCISVGGTLPQNVMRGGMFGFNRLIEREIVVPFVKTTLSQRSDSDYWCGSTGCQSVRFVSTVVTGLSNCLIRYVTIVRYLMLIMLLNELSYRQDKRMDELSLFIDYHTKYIVSII